MKNLSQLENQILNGIIKSEYQDRNTSKEDLVNTIVYINKEDVGMDCNEFPGAIRSCFEKGLVSTRLPLIHHYAEICITELGWNELNK